MIVTRSIRWGTKLVSYDQIVPYLISHSWKGADGGCRCKEMTVSWFARKKNYFSRGPPIISSKIEFSRDAMVTTWLKPFFVHLWYWWVNAVRRDTGGLICIAEIEWWSHLERKDGFYRNRPELLPTTGNSGPIHPNASNTSILGQISDGWGWFRGGR